MSQTELMKHKSGPSMIIGEMNAMSLVNHPFIINLHFAFHDTLVGSCSSSYYYCSILTVVVSSQSQLLFGLGSKSWRRSTILLETTLSI